MTKWGANGSGTAPASIFERKVIAGKRVYVVDDHHKALAAWAEERRRLGAAPNLITIDHHTDTIEAFHNHASGLWPDDIVNEEAVRDSLSSKIDWRSDESILSAIALLVHDEHIHAATMAGVLNAAFCIQLSDGDGTPSLETSAYEAEMEAAFASGAPMPPKPRGSMTYAPTPDRIYVIPFRCAINCENPVYNDECVVHHAWEIIEARYLDDQLARGAEMARCIDMADMESDAYILDIDLDCFHSSRAVHPEDAATFYRLIRNAIAVTIATEANCVRDLWKGAPPALTADELLEIVMEHIETALKG